jgi:hypothetical protein
MSQPLRINAALPISAADPTSPAFSDTGFLNVQECLDVRRKRDQTRASAAALPEMYAADAAGPTNGTVRQIARAFYV